MRTKNFVLIALSLIFLSGILITYAEGQKYYLVFLLSGIVLLVSIFFVINIFDPTNKLYINIKYLITYLLFLSSNLVSTIVNGEFNLILSSLQYFIVFTVLTFLIINLNIKFNMRLIIFIFILLNVAFLFIGTIENLPVTFPYYAQFDNPNTLGILAAGIFSTSISIIMLSKVKLLELIFYILTAIFSFILIVYSGSRTSLFTIIAVVFTLMLFNQIKVIIVNKRNVFDLFMNLIKWPFIFTIGLMLIFIMFETTLNETVFDKINRKAASGDFLSYRSHVWINTIKEAKLFGRGSEYFIESYGVGAHNTFISILGQFGIFSTVFFLIIIIIYLVDSIKYALKNIKSDFSALPFIVTLSFVMLSLAEIMLMKSIMFLMLVLMGIVSQSIAHQKKEVMK